MRSANRCNEPLAMGRSHVAAVIASRNGNEASSETGANEVKAISPSTSTMSGPRSAGAMGVVSSGAVRRKRLLGAGVGSHRRRRRQTSSLTQAIWRPAVDTENMRASASSNPSADATWSWSCRRSLSCSRWARRWSSTRMSVSSAVAPSRDARSAYSARRGAKAEMARSTLTSRSPPWLSLRSGSRRNATSPAVARRSAICSLSSGR